MQVQELMKGGGGGGGSTCMLQEMCHERVSGAI